MRAVDLLECIIRPVLQELRLGGSVAELLVLGTAAQESELGLRLRQAHGPAVGLYQIESATAQEIFTRYPYAIRPWLMPGFSYLEQLVGNPYLGTAVCRMIYYRVQEPLPDRASLTALGVYWKAHYNTPAGAGTVAQFIANYHRCVPGVLEV
jgi:hypothetical protein